MNYKEDFMAVCIKPCGYCDFTAYIKQNDNYTIECPEFDPNSNEGAEHDNNYK